MGPNIVTNQVSDLFETENSLIVDYSNSLIAVEVKIKPWRNSRIAAHSQMKFVLSLVMPENGSLHYLAQYTFKAFQIMPAFSYIITRFSFWQKGQRPKSTGKLDCVSIKNQAVQLHYHTTTMFRFIIVGWTHAKLQTIKQFQLSYNLVMILRY